MSSLVVGGKTVHVGLRLEPELVAWLDKQEAENERSRSAELRRLALRESARSNEREAA